MTGTKKSLIASGVSLAVSVALLVGSTFAWFTDSVTNKGNKIQAGNLKIGAYAYDLDENGDKTFTIENVNGGNPFTFEAEPQNLKTDGTPIISETLWEPGKSSAKLLQVVNEGTLAAEIKLSFETSGELEGALWFDFVKVEDGKITGKFEKRPMSTLSAVAGALELPIINSGDTLEFILVYGMYEEAGNEYKDKDFTADVTILAKQYTYEEDGFGSSDYDENAKYPAATNTELVTSLENGGTVTAAGAFKWSDAVTMTGDTKSVLSLEKDAEITVVDDGIFDLYGSSELTISGEGALNQTFDSELGYLLRAGDNSKVRIDGGTFIAGLTCVQAGGNSSVEIYGGHFEALADWGGTYWLLNLIDNSAATITVYGGTFVNFDPSKSSTENPQANFVADGYKVISEEKDNGDIWYTVVPE